MTPISGTPCRWGQLPRLVLAPTKQRAGKMRRPRLLAHSPDAFWERFASGWGPRFDLVAGELSTGFVLGRWAYGGSVADIARYPAHQAFRS
jgi:hypothetical protein